MVAGVPPGVQSHKGKDAVPMSNPFLADSYLVYFPGSTSNYLITTSVQGALVDLMTWSVPLISHAVTEFPLQSNGSYHVGTTVPHVSWCRNIHTYQCTNNIMSLQSHWTHVISLHMYTWRVMWPKHCRNATYLFGGGLSFCGASWSPPDAYWPCLFYSYSFEHLCREYM